MMRSLSKAVYGLGALLACAQSLPLSAQGPVQQPRAAKTAIAPLAVPASPAGSAAPLDATDLEAWLDGFLPYALEHGRIAGAVVVVVRGGGVVLQKGYGYSDLASRKPVSPDATLFRPGSVSKLLTWTAVMQQVEAGKIDLDKDVNAYLDFRIPPLDGKPVTMRDLMTHGAGFEESLRHLVTNDGKPPMPLARLMRETLPARVFAPGTTPAYSNYGAALAGYIVERVSGIPFDDYVEQRIFAPAGMTRSSFRQPLPKALQPMMARGYLNATEEPKPFEMIGPGPAGSLSATGADMGRFMMAHLNLGGALLKPGTARLMHDFRAPGLGALNTMALGFYEQWVNGRRAIAHGGDTQWFHSYLWLFPKDDIGLFISMNSVGKDGAVGAVRSALFHKFADRYLPDMSAKPGRVDDATARRHARMIAGNYGSSRGSFTNFLSLTRLIGQATVEVGADGKIAFPMLDGLGAGARDWVEVSPFLWRDRNSGERLAAEVRDGKVVRLSTDAVSPFMIFEPVSAGFNAAWLMPALLGSLAIVLLSALAWPAGAIMRRSFGAQLVLSGRARLAHHLSRGLAWAVLGVTAGWMAFSSALSSDVGLLGGPLDWLIQSLRLLTPLAAAGLVVATGWLLLLRLRGRHGWIGSTCAALLLAAGLLLSWVAFATHLYGFSLVY